VVARRSLNHEELRTQFKRQLELEAADDRAAQLRLKAEMAERQRDVDRHYHDLVVADVEARRRREERETIARNRANHVQVQALVEQIAASEKSAAVRDRRIADEHRYLVCTIQYNICKAPCCRGFRGAGEQGS